jgi:hypothetical protein
MVWIDRSLIFVRLRLGVSAAVAALGTWLARDGKGD